MLKKIILDEILDKIKKRVKIIDPASILRMNRKDRYITKKNISFLNPDGNRIFEDKEKKYANIGVIDFLGNENNLAEMARTEDTVITNNGTIVAIVSYRNDNNNSQKTIPIINKSDIGDSVNSPELFFTDNNILYATSTNEKIGKIYSVLGNPNIRDQIIVQENIDEEDNIIVCVITPEEEEIVFSEPKKGMPLNPNLSAEQISLADPEREELMKLFPNLKKFFKYSSINLEKAETLVDLQIILFVARQLQKRKFKNDYSFNPKPEATFQTLNKMSQQIFAEKDFDQKAQKILLYTLIHINFDLILKNLSKKEIIKHRVPLQRWSNGILVAKRFAIISSIAAVLFAKDPEDPLNFFFKKAI